MTAQRKASSHSMRKLCRFCFNFTRATRRALKVRIRSEKMISREMKSVLLFAFTSLLYPYPGLLTTVKPNSILWNMLFKKNRSSEQDPDTIEVRLKPILGISPRHYVPTVWLAIALALIFFLLILPGINQNGTMLTVYSDPPDASVITDGIRAGRTYESVFIPKGNREIRIRRPGFKDEIITKKISGRIFASWLFPKRREIVIVLEPEEPYSIMKRGMNEFSRWNATGADNNRYAIPSSFTRLARDSTVLDSHIVDLAPLVKACLPLARDVRHLADINRGLQLFSSPKSVTNPFQLAAYIGETAQMLEELSLMAGVLELMNQKPDTGPATPSSLETRQIYQELRLSRDFIRGTVNGQGFVSIPSLKAPIGDVEIVDSGEYFPRYGAHPVEASVENFQIAIREVSIDEFAAFIQEVPYWSKKNKGELMRNDLVDDDYLESWTDQMPVSRGGYPVTEISWYAAMAYADWLTEKVYPDGRGRFRLPQEDEWEIAARINNGTLEDSSELSEILKPTDKADEGNIGLQGMAGNVREWGYNPFRYNENRFRPPSGKSSYMDVESDMSSEKRPVRGAAFIDDGMPYPISARGSLEAHQTSPVVGFRLVIP